MNNFNKIRYRAVADLLHRKTFSRCTAE